MLGATLQAQPAEVEPGAPALWLGQLNQIRLSRRLGIWADLHLRAVAGDSLQATLGIVRVAPVWYVTDQARLAAGYAFLNHFPNEGHRFVHQPEHMLWAQLQWFNQYPHLRTMQWLRLEQRYRRRVLNDYELGEGYTPSSRVRYNLAVFVPVTKRKFQPGGLFLAVNDELHMNLGQPRNYFNQNRAFAGLGVQTGPHSQLHVGYMHLFVYRSASDTYLRTHTLRIFWFLNLARQYRKAGA
jgi:hypothetical protein